MVIYAKTTRISINHPQITVQGERRRQVYLDYAEPQPQTSNETARRKALISNFLQGGILFFDNFRQ